jgi:hypothetical protein
MASAASGCLTAITKQRFSDALSANLTWTAAVNSVVIDVVGWKDKMRLSRWQNIAGQNSRVIRSPQACRLRFPCGDQNRHNDRGEPTQSPCRRTGTPV